MTHYTHYPPKTPELPSEERCEHCDADAPTRTYVGHRNAIPEVLCRGCLISVMLDDLYTVAEQICDDAAATVHYLQRYQHRSDASAIRSFREQVWTAAADLVRHRTHADALEPIVCNWCGLPGRHDHI